MTLTDNMVGYVGREPNISSFVPECVVLKPNIAVYFNFIDLLRGNEVHMENEDTRLGYSFIYAGIGILCVAVINLIEVVIKIVI